MVVKKIFVNIFRQFVSHVFVLLCSWKLMRVYFSKIIVELWAFEHLVLCLMSFLRLFKKYFNAFFVYELWKGPCELYQNQYRLIFTVFTDNVRLDFFFLAFACWNVTLARFVFIGCDLDNVWISSNGNHSESFEWTQTEAHQWKATRLFSPLYCRNFEQLARNPLLRNHLREMRFLFVHHFIILPRTK